MASRILRSVILGAPGCGKGTISKRIIKDFGWVHLASGDLLRAQVAAKTPVGLAAQGFIQRGQLVPDDVITELMNSELSPLKDNWLLDGFPRTVAQAESLTKQQHIDVVLNLDVPFDTIRERLEKRWTHLPSGRVYHLEWNPPKVPYKDDATGEDLVQRNDDKPETVSMRLETYERQTKPLMEYFSQLGILATFKGTESDVIYPLIKRHISQIIL